MSRYIDADAFETFGYTRPIGKYDFDDGVEFVLNKIDEQPTADVRENVRGEWIGAGYDGYADGYPVFYEWECSACGCTVEDEEPTWNFCPNCGADMRKGEENDNQRSNR